MADCSSSHHHFVLCSQRGIKRACVTSSCARNSSRPTLLMRLLLARRRRKVRFFMLCRLHCVLYFVDCVWAEAKGKGGDSKEASADKAKKPAAAPTAFDYGASVLVRLCQSLAVCRASLRGERGRSSCEGRSGDVGKRILPARIRHLYVPLFCLSCKFLC